MNTPFTPLWHARLRPGWRDDGSAVMLIGALFLFLLALAGFALLRYRPAFAPTPDIQTALMLSGGLLAVIGIFLHAGRKGEWTLDERALHFTVGRTPRPDVALSCIRFVDIVDRHDGLCDLLVYLQPGPGSDSFGCVLIPRLPKDNAEAGLEALRRLGVPVAPPVDSAAHAFPVWMTPRDRRLLATRFGRGERLLWVESDPPRIPFLVWTVLLFFFVWHISTECFNTASIASRLRAAFSSSDWSTVGLIVGLLALQALPLVGVVLLPTLFVRANRWQTLRWITTHRLGGVCAPDGRRFILIASCLAEPPVLVPRSRNRADLLVAPLDDPSPSLADLAASPSPRPRAIAFRRLSSTDAASALAALRSLLPPS